MYEINSARNSGKQLAVIVFMNKFISEGDTFAYYGKDLSKDRENYLIEEFKKLGSEVEIKRLTGIDHNTGVAGIVAFEISLKR